LLPKFDISIVPKYLKQPANRLEQKQTLQPTPTLSVMIRDINSDDEIENELKGHSINKWL